MKKHNFPFKKVPKVAHPVRVEGAKGGCWYFSVKVDEKRLSLSQAFTIRGLLHPMPWYMSWRDKERSFGVTIPKNQRYLQYLATLSYGLEDDLSRTFKYNGKAFGFYKKIVEDQNLEAYKEAIKATI